MLDFGQPAPAPMKLAMPATSRSFLQRAPRHSALGRQSGCRRCVQTRRSERSASRVETCVERHASKPHGSSTPPRWVLYMQLEEAKYHYYTIEIPPDVQAVQVTRTP